MDAVYRLREGRVALCVEVNGHDILLGGLRTGNWVGEGTDLSKPPLACTAVNASPAAKLARLSDRDFGALLADVEPIAAAMRVDDDAAGRVFVAQGNLAKAPFLVLDGKVSVCRDGRTGKYDCLKTLQAGDSSGLSSLAEGEAGCIYRISPLPRSAAASSSSSPARSRDLHARQRAVRALPARIHGGGRAQPLQGPAGQPSSCRIRAMAARTASGAVPPGCRRAASDPSRVRT